MFYSIGLYYTLCSKLNAQDVDTMNLKVRYISITLMETTIITILIILILCGNCHAGLHHGKWKLNKKQTPIAELGKTPHNLTEWRFDRRDEVCYLNKIAELELKIIEIEHDHTKQNGRNRIDIMERSMIIESMIQYVSVHSYKTREDLILLQTVFNAYIHSVVNNSDGWSAYKPDKEMEEIIKKYGNRVIQEHYMTPSTDEMKEITEMKPII